MLNRRDRAITGFRTRYTAVYIAFMRLVLVQPWFSKPSIFTISFLLIARMSVSRNSPAVSRRRLLPSFHTLSKGACE